MANAVPSFTVKTFERYQRAIQFIEGLSNLPEEKEYMHDRSEPTIYLKRMEYFLGLLGHPEKGPEYIHVTGTSGKGTVTTMLHEILHAAGQRVGSFTSPFVTTTIEKMRVDDSYISPEEFADIIEDLKGPIDEAYLRGPYGKPSYFETCLAVAFVHFKQKKCKWVVLEVGAGGRYDATNIITQPQIMAITNVDYDHTQLLGKTLQKIARDKAGIIKRGGTFFTSEQRPRLMKIFKDICASEGVPFHQIPHQVGYQNYNQSLVTAIAKKLKIDGAHIKQGIERTHLQCRFEVMQNKPLVVLDGAHNRAKIKSTIENLGRLKYNRIHLIIGISDNKDHIAMLEQIIPLADAISFTRFQIKDRKCAHPKSLAEKSKQYIKQGANTQILLDPTRALTLALSEAKPDDLILVTGSFYLAGELRKHWVSEEKILKGATR